MTSNTMLPGDVRPFIRSAGQIYLRPDGTTDVATGFRKAYDHRLFYIREGGATFVVGGQAAPLKQGDAILLLAGTAYDIRPESDPVSMWYVNFDFFAGKQHMDLTLPTVPPEEFDPAKCMETDGFGRTLFPEGYSIFYNAFVLQTDLDALVQEFDRAELLYQSQVRALMTLCLNRFFRNMNQSNPHRGPGTHQDILAYISAHFAENLTNRSIAERFHYHPNYVNQIIRAQTGISLHQYLLRLRIHRATELLLSDGGTIHEIAARTGFSDPNYFTQYFRRCMGCSPSVFRGNSRKNGI